MDHASYIRGFFCSKRLYVPAIIVMIFTVQQSCVLGYEEIIGFNQNFTSSFDDCSRIVWYPDISEGHNSPPAFRSGPIRNSGLSCVSKMVYGPANINFFWKVYSGRERIGELSFNVDNETIIFCQSSEWSPASYAISPGRHFLSWVYKKQYSYPEYDGVGWIDDIRISYENGTYQQILTKPADYISERQLSSIERNISLIKERLSSLESRQNITKDFVPREFTSLKNNISIIEDKLGLIGTSLNISNDTTIGLQLISLNNSISMIEERLDFLDSLRNITKDIVFIPNDPNVNLTNEINKHKNKVIILDVGTYHTSGLVINTSNVYIMPRLKWKTILDGNGAQRGIFIHNSRNVTLDSLVINDSLCSIRIDNCSDISIRGSLIIGFSKYGIRILNSNNSKIEGNRFTTTYCNAINALNIFNGSHNFILANRVDLLACGDVTTRISYALNNSSENFVQVLDDGYIRDNNVKCQFKDNKYLCQYNGVNITADFINRSANIWSFSSYVSLNNSGV